MDRDDVSRIHYQESGIRIQKGIWIWKGIQIFFGSRKPKSWESDSLISEQPPHQLVFSVFLEQSWCMRWCTSSCTNYCNRFLSWCLTFFHKTWLTLAGGSPIKVWPFRNVRARTFAGMLELLWDCNLGHSRMLKKATTDQKFGSICSLAHKFQIWGRIWPLRLYLISFVGLWMMEALLTTNQFLQNSSKILQKS